MDRETKRVAIQLAFASSIGISMVIAIFGCLFLGVWLDRKLETAPYLTLIFLLMGIVAGFRNVVLLIKRAARPGKDVQSPPNREKTAAITGEGREENQRRAPSKEA